jgi:perosamine synthetase
MSYKINQIQPFLNNKEKNSIKETIKNKWLTAGNKSKKFISMLTKLHKCKYGVLVPNGTIAITLALMALKLKKNSEVIMPNFTFFGTYSAIVLAGLKPILCDVDDKNFQIDLDSANKILTKNTKAIMPVHIYGGSVDMKKLLAFGKKHKLKIIEDAAQAIGVKYKNKPAGTLSDVAAFSFYADKTITTGEGGLVLTNKKNIYENLLKYQNQGRKKSGIFIHNHIGYNFRFNDVLASIGIEQLKKLNLIKKNKLKIYKLYKKELKNIKQVKFFTPIRYSNFIPFRVPVTVENLNKLINFLEKKRIQTRRFFYPMHKQKAINASSIKNKNKNFFNNSIKAYKHGLALPCFPSLKTLEIKYICKMIKKFYEKK